MIWMLEPVKKRLLSGCATLQYIAVVDIIGNPRQKDAIHRSNGSRIFLCESVFLNSVGYNADPNTALHSFEKNCNFKVPVMFWSKNKSWRMRDRTSNLQSYTIAHTRYHSMLIQDTQLFLLHPNVSWSLLVRQAGPRKACTHLFTLTRPMEAM